MLNSGSFDLTDTDTADIVSLCPFDVVNYNNTLAVR